MYYASFGALALVLHIIINHEFVFRRLDASTPAVMRRYRAFLISVMVYYVADILWGYLYSLRIVPLVYADTVLYFMSMVSSVLLWTHSVVSYIDPEKRFARFLTYAGWTIFSSEVVCLIINIFWPIIFAFKPDGEYAPGAVRYVTLALQVVLYLLSSCHTIFYAAKSTGRIRIRNKTVAGSGVVMALFIVLQAMYPLLPFYAIGLLVGTCLIHVFVEEGEKFAYRIELREMEKKAERERQETIKAKKHNITFNRIAESLALNYDVIYYVDTRDDSYVGYTSNHIYGKLEVNRAGDDFFTESLKNLEVIIHPKDKERVATFLNRDYLLTALEVRKQFTSDYRMLINGKPQYTRIVVRKSSSGEHFIIAVENVDEEIRHEMEQKKALDTEKELARRDELTGTKNKTAYAELEQSLQDNLNRDKVCPPFAIVICDINDLKRINDTEGHKAGDELIQSAAKLLCDIFVHSPVFRIGGDEFAVYLSGDDYIAREELVGRLRAKTFENGVRKSGPVIAVGIATYNTEKDFCVSDVFERADERMYKNKRELKEEM